MPAIFAQHGLRQNAPGEATPKPEAPLRRGRVLSEKTKLLIAMWGDTSRSVEEIAAEIGYANAAAAYAIASYHNLPYRPTRPRKGTV